MLKEIENIEKMKVLTLGDEHSSLRSLLFKYPKVNTVINDKLTTILILSTGERTVKALSIRHLSALLIPAASPKRTAWLINYPSRSRDFDILAKFEKAILELTLGKTERWETRFVTLYSEKAVDRSFLIEFNLEFQRRRKNGGGGNFNFVDHNCSDSIDFMLKQFFPQKMVIPAPSRKNTILGFFCTPCFILTCAASYVPRPVHPKTNNPMHVLTVAKRLKNSHS